MTFVWVVVLPLVVVGGMALSPLALRRIHPPAPPPPADPVAYINGRRCAHRLDPVTGRSYWEPLNEQRSPSKSPR